MTRVLRRTLLGIACATSCWPGRVLALGRTPLGGHLRLSLPWDTKRIDPHDLNDPLAAFLGHAVFEPLYAQDDSGRIYPTLAEGLPEAAGTNVVISLRPGLRSASGKPLDARDLLWSLHRSRRSGGASRLLNFSAPKPMRGRPLSVLFPQCSSADVARSLASPLTALVSQGSTPEKPDGCGPFSAAPGAALVLRRNMNAARGPAYLDRITCSPHDSISSALRAFEVGRADVGWLGRGLHRARTDSTLQTLGSVGWLVLRTGSAAGRWSAPGAAAQLVAALEPAQLLRFGLNPLPAGVKPASYGGPACEMLIRDDSSYLRELGEALSVLLAQTPGSIALKLVSAGELQRRKQQDDFALLLDVVRHPGGPLRAQQLSLLAEVSNKLIRRAPPLDGDDTAALARATRTLPLAIVGELELRLALTQEFAALKEWHLGDVWKRQPLIKRIP